MRLASRTTAGLSRAQGQEARESASGELARFFLCATRGLTFDMSGRRQQAKPDVGRPLDGRVRPQATCSQLASSSQSHMARTATKLTVNTAPRSRTFVVKTWT